jgi:hypothetical protein
LLFIIQQYLFLPATEIIILLTVYDGPNVGPISINLSVRFDLIQQNSQIEKMALFLKLPFQSAKKGDPSATTLPVSKMAADTSAALESHIKLFSVELQFYSVLVPDMRGTLLSVIFLISINFSNECTNCTCME